MSCFDAPFFENIFENLTEGVQVLDRDWRYLYLNEAACQHGQCQKSELLGRTLPEVYPDLVGTPVFELMKRCMEESTSAELENLFEHKGAQRWFQLHIDPLPEGIIVRSMDITDKKEIEQKFLQSQKLEAVGRLAGGIAHDFNNYLSSILLETEVLIDKSQAQPKKLKSLKHILQATNRAKELTQQLLIFSKREMRSKEIVDVNTLIEKSRYFWERVLSSHIVFKCELNAEISAIQIEKSQLEQIIMNILVNAKQVMSAGGEFVLRSFNEQENSVLVLEFEDSGEGMSEEVKQRLFEPFFTTKKQNYSAGLGLPMVLGIVQQHHGEIEVESTLGKGSLFRVKFKTTLDEQKVSETQDLESDQGAESILHKGKILYVEDDEMIAEITTGILEEQGHEIHYAKNGEDALQLLNQALHKNEIYDLLVTDIMMPGISGIELVKRVRKIVPSLKIIIMSGYSEEHPEGIVIDPSCFRFLQKPVKKKVILDEIQTLLAY